MFKDLFAFLDANYSEPQTAFEKSFFDGIEKFAFYNDLNSACTANEGMGIKELISGGNYKAVVANLLGSKGLNYGALPKGLLKFHSYNDTARTPFQEHMAEGALYASGATPLQLLPTAPHSATMTAPSCSVRAVTAL